MTVGLMQRNSSSGNQRLADIGVPLARASVTKNAPNAGYKTLTYCSAPEFKRWVFP
jgi:hypothetical protein